MKSSLQIAAVSLALVFPAVANADFYEVSGSTGWLALSPFSTSVSVDQFDDLSGTRILTSVDLFLDALEQASVTIENGSSSGATVRAALSGNVTATGPGSSPLSATAITNFTSDAVELAANGQESGLPTYNSQGDDFHDYGQLTGSGSDSDTVTTSLSTYIGGGVISFDVDAAGGWAASGTSDANTVTAGFQGRGDITVRYNYNVVPEPSAAALLLLVGCIGGLIRRQRS